MKFFTTCAATFLAVGLFAVLAGCETSPRTEAKRQNLIDEANATVRRFEREDPGVKDMTANAAGYAVFPEVGKGGFVVGGAYGKGVLFERGNAAGYSDVTQGTVGAQIGGQTYDELIVFQTPDALNSFKNNRLAFSANASAVAIKAGAATTARYQDGVAIFTMPRGGLMAEAAVGGQK